MATRTKATKWCARYKTYEENECFDDGYGDAYVLHIMLATPKQIESVTLIRDSWNPIGFRLIDSDSSHHYWLNDKYGISDNGFFGSSHFILREGGREYASPFGYVPPECALLVSRISFRFLSDLEPRKVYFELADLWSKMGPTMTSPLVLGPADTAHEHPDDNTVDSVSWRLGVRSMLKLNGTTYFESNSLVDRLALYLYPRSDGQLVIPFTDSLDCSRIDSVKY